MGIHKIKWCCNWPACAGAIKQRRWKQSDSIDEGYANLVLKCPDCGNISPHTAIIEDKE